jgi:hypothetical protein
MDKFGLLLLIGAAVVAFLTFLFWRDPKPKRTPREASTFRGSTRRGSDGALGLASV